ncbi:MAG: MerR family transcriptional regulator [Clostridiales Family XIII bacterium]|jgi:DNA-binding transcriptional MerR regulator|nr:MerR family transcriptional regulator [Clostridiales Family XIII bacterium]
MIGNELLSIKEFSKLTGVKESALRYFDNLGLFSPAKRGANGYRYYSPQQIITINSINLLHDLGMPTREITDIEGNRTPELMHEVLTKKENELETEFHRIEKAYNVVHTLRRMISLGRAADEDSIETRYIDELPLVVGPKNDFGNSKMFYDAFLKFCDQAPAYRIDLRLPVGGKFEDFSSFIAAPSEPTWFFSCDPKGLDKRVAGKFLCAYGRGYYGQYAETVARMKAYIEERGLKPNGPVYIAYLLDELSEIDPDNYLAQILVSVE